MHIAHTSPKNHLPWGEDRGFELNPNWPLAKALTIELMAVVKVFLPSIALPNQGMGWSLGDAKKTCQLDRDGKAY